jgi:serine/threonine-protein kinase
VTAFVGKSGIGGVFRARNLKLNRVVAIKVLPDEFLRDSEGVGRYQREAGFAERDVGIRLCPIRDFPRIAI